jgi:hypothetical protein
MSKMNATIAYLRDAAAKLQRAADLLDEQGGWHLHQARGNAQQAVEIAERCIRQIDRKQQG